MRIPFLLAFSLLLVVPPPTPAAVISSTAAVPPAEAPGMLLPGWDPLTGAPSRPAASAVLAFSRSMYGDPGFALEDQSRETKQTNSLTTLIGLLLLIGALLQYLLSPPFRNWLNNLLFDAFSAQKWD